MDKKLKKAEKTTAGRKKQSQYLGEPIVEGFKVILQYNFHEMGIKKKF